MSDCEYELVVLQAEDFEEVVLFLDKHFFPRDPLSVVLHIVDNHTREGRDGESVHAALCSGVSIGARMKNGELAGLLLSVIENRGECYDLKPGLQLVPLQEDANTLVEMASHGVDMFGSEHKLLKMLFVGVAEEHGRKGFGSRLTKECIRLGVAAGCNRAATQVTNRYSGYLLKKLGFETVNILDLTKLGPEYKGPSLDIDNVNGNSTICIMIKQGLP